MAIYQNANGNWGVDWRDEFGRRHRQQVGSREAAQAVERRILEQMAEKPKPVQAALTLVEAADLYMQNLNVSERTRETYRHAFGKIAEQLGNQRLDKLAPADFTEWARRNGEAYGQNTMHLRITMAKRLFTWLEAQGYSRNLAAALKPPKKRLGAFHIVSYEEEATLLEAAKNPRIRLRVLLALDAGMGLQDAAHIRRSMWNAESGLLLYTRHKTNVNAVVPTTPRLASALAPLRGMPPGALLTATHEIRRQTDALSNLRDRTGIQFTSHDLRRTFATRLAAVETNPIVVAALLGHRTPWAVQMAYVHPTEEMLREAIARMAAANPNQWEEATAEIEEEITEGQGAEKPAPDPEAEKAKSHEIARKRIDHYLKIG